MVEAIDFLHVVIKRAAHDEPHHHFYAFRPCLAQIFDMRDADERLGIACEIIEKALVEFLVDQPCARPEQPAAGPWLLLRRGHGDQVAEW